MENDQDQSVPEETPASARVLSLTLLVWCGVGALSLLGLYAVYFR
jgi:hypothetical protein